MADDEDDYLSDKFLLESAPAPSKPKIYAERRKEAQRRAALKNEQNRKKSRRQLEQEAREEGLSKSLFERARDEEASGQQNKALAMMMKMGYKPGESLGQKYDEPPTVGGSGIRPQSAAPDEDPLEDAHATPERNRGGIGHRTEPLPLNEWIGTSSSPSSPLFWLRVSHPRARSYSCTHRQDGHRCAQTGSVSKRSRKAGEDGKARGGDRPRNVSRPCSAGV